MALEEIFLALEEQAEKECQDVLSAARAQGEAIAKDAAEQAERIRATCIEKARIGAQLKVAEATNAVRRDARKRVASVKDEAVRQVFDMASAKLGTLRTSGSYPEVFRALAAEATAGVEGEIVLLVDPADADLAAGTIEALGFNADVLPELSTSGGLVVVTGGGRIMRRNTVEDRIEKAQPNMQTHVAEILFS